MSKANIQHLKDEGLRSSFTTMTFSLLSPHTATTYHNRSHHRSLPPLTYSHHSRPQSTTTRHSRPLSRCVDAPTKFDLFLHTQSSTEQIEAPTKFQVLESLVFDWNRFQLGRFAWNYYGTLCMMV